MEAREIGLAEAAQLLGIPYQDAHRLLLIGRLRGQKRGGRWWVAAESVHEVVRERGQQVGAHARHRATAT